MENRLKSKAYYSRLKIPWASAIHRFLVGYQFLSKSISTVPKLKGDKSFV